MFVREISPSPCGGVVASRDPHGERGRMILAAHPEIRALMKRDPSTAAWIAATASGQLLLAAMASVLPWWGVPLLAYAIGAFLALGLWTLLHETSHDLVARRAATNRLLGLVASLPIGLPVAATFRKYHRLHHRHLGDPRYDADIARGWELHERLSLPAGKLVWLALNSVIQSFRIGAMHEVGLVDRRFLVNLAIQLTFNVLVVLVFGWAALIYLLLSNVFAFGLHPLGGRLIQEHFVFVPGQETASYYGAANRVVFNAGYHVEHHDLMGIPWRSLPRLRAMAPEFYDDLHSHASWSRLVIAFLADPNTRLDTRVTR